MMSLHYVGVGVVAGALAGFSIAWHLKPSGSDFASDSVSPLQARVDRRPVSSRPLGRAAPSAFSQQWEELENDEDGKEKREALLAGLGPEEFPALMAEMDDKAGLSGLDNPGDNQLRDLFNAWFRKAPDVALAWLRALPKAKDRQRLLYGIVDEVAEIDPDRAVSMLRQDGADENGHIFIPDRLLEKAVSQSEDKLLEICKLGLHRGGDWPNSCRMSFPEGFDFRRVLDGLAAAQAEIGEDGRFASIPSNLVSEWAKRDFQSAWNWLKDDKTVIYNGMSDLIGSVPPADAGALLAAGFDATAKEDKRYEDAVMEMYRTPSPEMLEAFLQAAPGERAVHLSGLFDELKCSNLGELQPLLLERMSPQQRSEALQRNFKNGTDPQTRSTLARLLRGLGHDEEEIQSLLPERKE